MRNKILIMGVVMLLMFSFAGCQSFNLAEYQEKGKTAIEAHAEARRQKGDITYAGQLVAAKVVADGKDAVDAASTKKAVDAAVKEAKEAIDKVEKEEISVAGISNLFDVTEPKEYWNRAIDDDFKDDRVGVILKRTTVYPELDVKDFGLENAESLEYYFLAPPNENPHFHQMLDIYLKTKGKEQVVSAINELNKLDFIQTAWPDYNYGTQHC